MTDIHKAFGAMVVLDGVDVSVEHGQTLVVLGRSGTGKSVLIKCLVGLLTPDRGRIEIDGQDVESLNGSELQALRQKLGFLFQAGALYSSMTVGENMSFAITQHNPDASDDELADRIAERLTWVGLPDTMDKLPSDLSGGQQKRIALARALMTDPELMLYDEPTTGLDPVTGNEIAQLIARLKDERGMTAIAITHDIPCAELIADRAVMLDNGKVIAEGTLDEFGSSDNPMVRFFMAGEFTRDAALFVDGVAQ